MPRERDMNRKMFHKGHYEVIAARFREQVARYINSDGDPISNSAELKLTALGDLADALANRFAFDNEEFDRKIFLERCGIVD